MCRVKKADSAFLAEPPRAICAKPTELVVKRLTFTTAMHIPYRSWRSMLGQTYYSVGEKQPPERTDEMQPRAKLHTNARLIVSYRTHQSCVHAIGRSRSMQ